MAQHRAFGVPKIKTNPEDITSSGQTSRSDPVRQIDSKTPKTFVFGATVTILARLGAAYRAFSYPDYTVGSGIPPDQPQIWGSRTLTAGRELHPALKEVYDKTVVRRECYLADQAQRGSEKFWMRTGVCWFRYAYLSDSSCRAYVLPLPSSRMQPRRLPTRLRWPSEWLLQHPSTTNTQGTHVALPFCQ